MKLLMNYITDFASRTAPDCKPLADRLSQAKASYDCRPPNAGNARDGFPFLVDAYNYIGLNKTSLGLAENPLRNLTGALLQDYMLSLVYEQLRDYPKLDVFTEANVALGLYPLWAAGEVVFEAVAERSDLAVGYLWNDEKREIRFSPDPWPRGPITAVPTGYTVLPLLAISSKIRVSKPEFFDWLGRAQLMGKGNPHCLNIVVALRKEMKVSIVEVAQVHGNFFLLGTGNEGRVEGFPEEVERLLERISDHLRERMGAGGPISKELEVEIEPSGNLEAEPPTGAGEP
jgi:hypothetical protein